MAWVHTCTHKQIYVKITREKFDISILFFDFYTIVREKDKEIDNNELIIRLENDNY